MRREIDWTDEDGGENNYELSVLKGNDHMQWWTEKVALWLGDILCALLLQGAVTVVGTLLSLKWHITVCLYFSLIFSVSLCVPFVRWCLSFDLTHSYEVIDMTSLGARLRFSGRCLCVDLDGRSHTTATYSRAHWQTPGHDSATFHKNSDF